jgi:hypothetical protein
VVRIQGRGNRTGALGGPVGDSVTKKWRICGHMEGGRRKCGGKERGWQEEMKGSRNKMDTSKIKS